MSLRFSLPSPLSSLSAQQDIQRGRDMVDSLFQGGQAIGGTHNAILSSEEYLSTAQRTLGNIEDGFYISPAFLDKLSIHVAKNFLDLPKIKVPLILGIWGGKGQGKTFQCNLAFKKLGIAPIVMSAGELESGNAGEPAKLIRQRYREASDTIKKGKMSSLFINDLDAGTFFLCVFFGGGGARGQVYGSCLSEVHDVWCWVAELARLHS